MIDNSLDNDRKLNPICSHRFSIQEIFKYHGCAQAAFDAGDYMLAATFSEPNSELKGSALVLSGLYEKGTEVLEQLSYLGPMGRICLAQGFWMDDRHRDAIAVLSNFNKSVDSCYQQIGQNLTRLIDNPEIIVFMISLTAPLFSSESDSTRAPEIKYGQFTSRQVTNQLDNNAYDYSFSDPFDTFLDSLSKQERPLFIYSMSPQSILPLHYNRINIPKIMVCHDTDIFLYRGFDNFALNDINIVNNSQEHFELSRSLGSPVISNLFCFEVPPADPSKLIVEKDIDILFTGAAFSGTISERSDAIYNINKLSDEFVVKIIDGHLPREEYQSLLSRSRFIPVLNRYIGATSPRWIESLLMSAYLLIPEDTLFSEISPGTCSFRPSSLSNDIRQRLIAYRDSSSKQDSSYNMSEIFPKIKQHLSFLQASREKQIERQLRFCVFNILLQNNLPAKPSKSTIRQRLTWYYPSIDAMLWGTGQVKSRMITIADKLDSNKFNDDIDYNNAGLIYTQILHNLDPDPSLASICKTKGMEYLEKGLQIYPRSLLLQFNKAHWSFMLSLKEMGYPKRTDLNRFKTIIQDLNQLEFIPKCSDLGIAFTNRQIDKVFPYYDYCNAMVKYLVQINTPDYESSQAQFNPRNVILAAAHGYLAWGLFLTNTLITQNTLSESLAHFKASLSAFNDNLPVKELQFNLLADHYTPKNSSDWVAVELVNAFFVYADKYPAALALDLHRVLPALNKLDEENTTKYLVHEWATFTRPITFLGDDKYRAISTTKAIVRYRHLFPNWLDQHINQLSKKSSPTKNNSSLDILTAMHEANNICQFDYILLDALIYSNQQI